MNMIKRILCSNWLTLSILVWSIGWLLFMVEHNHWVAAIIVGLPTAYQFYLIRQKMDLADILIEKRRNTP